MAFLPDPDIINLWVYQPTFSDNNNAAGLIQVSPNFNYSIMTDYVFVFDGLISLNPYETLKEVNEKCYENYGLNSYVSLSNNGLFKFKKRIRTTTSLNTYYLMKEFAKYNAKRPPLAANLFTLAAACRVNTNAIFTTLFKFDEDLHTYFRGMLNVMEFADPNEEIYTFQVKVKPVNKRNYTIEDRKWTIKQLLEKLADENETELPILCRNVAFFELIIARMMELQMIIPAAFKRETIYLTHANGQRLTPTEESMYYARNQTAFTDNDDFQNAMQDVKEAITVEKSYCFYVIDKNVNATTKAYFVLFRDDNTYRIAFLN